MDITIASGSEVERLDLSDQIVGQLYPDLSNGEQVASAKDLMILSAFNRLVTNGMDFQEALTQVTTQITEVS